MQLHRVDLNLFVVFDVIYTEVNLTRAAEVLNLTQPTVSNALARLRRSFNDPLFVRTPGGMTPTPVAQNMIGSVRDALRLLDTSFRESGHFEPATCDRVFRISMNDYTQMVLLPDLMAELHTSAPGIRIESYHTPRRDLSLALSSANLDMAIDVAGRADAQLCSTPLLQEKHVCLVRPGHPGVGDELSMDDYLALDHIHVSSRPRGRGLVDIQLARLGHQRRIGLRLEHYLVAPEIVERTDMALTVPSYWAQHTPLKALALPFDVQDQDLHLIWHRSADNDPASVWLRDRIKTRWLG